MFSTIKKIYSAADIRWLVMSGTQHPPLCRYCCILNMEQRLIKSATQVNASESDTLKRRGEDFNLLPALR